VASYDTAIPPGGEGTITVQLRTRGYRGRITKSAAVYTNDPVRRKTQISLSVTVRPRIIVEPGHRVVLRGIIGDDIRQVRRIRPGDDHPLEISRVETNLESLIDCELRPKGQGHEYELEVANEGSRRIATRGFVKLLTNHPRERDVTLWVFLDVRPELESWPRELSFQRTSTTRAGKGALRRVLTLVNNRGREFRLQGVEYNDQYFRVRPVARTGRPGSRQQLEVEPRLDHLPAGRIGVTDTLVIRTDAGAVEVPLSIRLESPT
jgi:hypothetical protein